MAVSKRLRFEVLRRDNHTCRYCGASAPEVKLVVDHVVPETLGGRSEPENLVTACEGCNSGKSSIPPDAPMVADVKQDAVRWARAMEEAWAVRRALVQERVAYGDRFLELWEEFHVGSKFHPRPVPLDGDWRSTLERFYEAGVAWDDLDYAVRTAMAAQHVHADRTFRYFCGIVWKLIREIQEAAGHIVVRQLDEEISGGHY